MCILFCCIFVLISLSTGAYIDLNSKTIEWISVQNDQVILMQPEPAGREPEWDFFLCRAEQDGNNFVGKLKVNRGKIACFIPASGKEVSKKDFQMLNSPPGVLSWIPLINSLPANAIIGSKSSSGKSFVCRANLNDSMLISGTYVESNSDSGNSSCNVPLDGKLYAISNKTEIEILAINKYGVKVGAQQT